MQPSLDKSVEPVVTSFELNEVTPDILARCLDGSGILCRNYGGDSWSPFTAEQPKEVGVFGEFHVLNDHDVLDAKKIVSTLSLLVGNMANRIKAECESAGVKGWVFTGNANISGFQCGTYAFVIKRDSGKMFRLEDRQVKGGQWELHCGMNGFPVEKEKIDYVKPTHSASFL